MAALRLASDIAEPSMAVRQRLEGSPQHLREVMTICGPEVVESSQLVQFFCCDGPSA